MDPKFLSSFWPPFGMAFGKADKRPQCKGHQYKKSMLVENITLLMQLSAPGVNKVIFHYVLISQRHITLHSYAGIRH